MRRWLQMTVTGLLAFALAGALAACGEETVFEDPAAEPDEQAAEPDPNEQAGGEMELTGTLGGDAELEGGCAWLDADDGTRYEVAWPDGYEVRFEPLELVGPDGETVARDGDTLHVTGELAEDAVSFCMVGTMFQAQEVAQP